VSLLDALMTDVVGVGVDIARRAWRSAARRDATGDAEEVDSWNIILKSLLEEEFGASHGV
jgi:hypothetical protein